MQRFDCLASDCPLFGPHLLEASAGTGKTFSIEHIFVRLLLEGIELEKILAVTFTRAATRELKKRIRENLQKALHALEKKETPWPYLEAYLGKPDSVPILRSSLELFDHSQIFTIHGFCYRMLSEFAFEARLGFSIPDPDGNLKTPPALRKALHRFWEELSEELVCPEQIGKIMRNSSMRELSARLLKKAKETEPGRSFSEISAAWNSAWSAFPIEEEKLQADFLLLAKNYKKKKGDFPLQITALAKKSLSTLIGEEGTLFEFIAPENEKVRKSVIEKLHYPLFFEWGRRELFPLIKEASDRKKIFSLIAQKWSLIAREICLEENHFHPDELLRQMRESIEKPPFAQKLSQKYSAVIIDEFQDTDPLQWEIFQKLLFKEQLRALYLVGDPKQSIYRFRNADVYTYFEARAFLGESHLYQLDTNFRSSKKLVDAMNALFKRKWLPLPKIESQVPYHPVQAALTTEPPFSDEKGAIHWVNVKPLYIWDYTIQEIEKLLPLFPRFSSFAILVKDRYQAQEALDSFRTRGIPARARSHLPLGETEAFLAIRELFCAILSPRDEALSRAVAMGPFGDDPPLFFWKTLLEEKGLVSFAREIPLEGPDERQIFEELFAWERREGFSFTGLIRFLDDLKELDVEEGGRRRVEDNEDAVQILTIHISKGLEFDIVFAWGVALSGSESDREIDAEKMRQLYVAMTRAKHRLYVPIPSDETSAMALFCKQVEAEEGPLSTYLKKLGEILSLTSEEVAGPILLPPREAPAALLPQPPPPRRWEILPSYLHSFTSLASSRSSDHALLVKPEGLPLGSEVGVAFHLIFEKLFTRPQPLSQLIQETLEHSPLLAWEKTIQEMIEKTLDLKLPGGFCLRELTNVFVEMEFLFHQPPHFIKGFIDLVFCFEEVYYVADWKTNWLGEKKMEQVMDEHDYWLQAALYAEAIRRYLNGKTFGGVFYFFIREGTFLHFTPERYGI